MQKQFAIILAVALAFAFLPMAIAEEGKPAQTTGEIDYGNLSIEDALRRLLEVDPEIRTKTLMADQSFLAVKASKLDVWMPKIKFSASAVKPIDMFTDLDQDHGPFFGQQLALDFTFDTNSLNRINKEKKAYDVSLAEIKDTVTNRAKELIASYYDLAAAQRGYQVCSQTEENISALLNQIKKDPSYTNIERSEVINYLGLVTEKKLGAFNRMKNSQRKMKALLGLEEKEDLLITVNESVEDVEQVKNLIKEASLRQPEYIIDLLKEKYEQAKIAERITLNPLLKFTLTPGFGVGEDRSFEVQTKATNVFQVNLFITDFGYTGGTQQADRIRTYIAKLEVLKAEEDLEYSDLLYDSTLVELNKKIDSYRDYVFRTEEALKVLKERVTFPVSTLLNINDQLLEAKYALKQILVNYVVTLSRMTGKELKPEKTSPEFQDLTLEGIFSRAEKAEKLTDEQVVEKTVELEKVRLRVAKLGYMPKLIAAARIQNDNIDGRPQQNTKAMLTLEGRLFNNKVKYAIREAEASMKKTEWRLKVFENERQDAIMSNYLKMLRLKRTIAGLSEIKKIKDGIIKEITEDIKSGYPKYVEAEVLPLLLQQMELDQTIAGLEASLALAEYGLKKWANIPLNEKITLKETDSFDGKGPGDFLSVIKRRILPNYDAEAAVKSVESGVEGAVAAEKMETAFEGVSWRLKGETNGPDFKGWRKPNSAVTLSLTVPWGNHGQRINKAIAARKRIKAQFSYARVQKGFAEDKQIAESRYTSTKDILEILKKKVRNSENQLKIAQELFDIGARTKKDLDTAKLETVVAKLTCDEAYFDTLYASARELLIFETSRQEEGDGAMTLSGLQEAIDLALQNSKEMKTYRDAVDLEEETLKYYTRFKLSGIGATDLAYLHSRDPKSNQTTKTGVAAATVDINLVNDLLIEEQRKRIELAKMDLERAKFQIAIEVADAYINYLNAMAEYSTTNAESLKEKAILTSMDELLKMGAIAPIDYLKQEEMVETLSQKARKVNEFCETFRNHLGILVGGLDPRFSIFNLEVYDEKKKIVIPVTEAEIKERLFSELSGAKKALLGPLYDELSKQGKLETDITKLDTKRVAAQIKSVAITVGYGYLTHYLGQRTKGETTFSQFDQLGLHLIPDKGPRRLAEFLSVNTSVNIYDATTGAKTRMSAIDEKIAETETRAELVSITQKAQQLFDEYQNAIENYQNLVKNTFQGEEDTRRDLESAKDSGKLTLVGQMEIRQNLFNNNIKMIEAFYRAMHLKNELDQYLRRYTGKGLDAFVNFKPE